MPSLSIGSAEQIREELDRIYESRAEVQRKLILEERRLDVLARVLGYEVYPLHHLLIHAKRRLPGPWRLYLAPRGCGKSTILTVVDSVLLPLLDPDVRILIGSRVKDQAKDILGEIQGCFKVERFCELFGDLRGDKWGTGEATVSTRTRALKEPTWMAAGADGPVTSKHFEHIKADDLVDEKNSRTEGERLKMWTFLYKTLVPTLIMRRKDGTPGEIDLIGTRYHPDDVYGRVMEEDGKFRGNVCEVPALVDPVTGEADGVNGVSVVEEILPTEELRSLRVSMGSAHFDSQFQQSTKRMKGDIFKEEMFSYYDEDPELLIRSRELRVWAACDLAISEEARADEYADAVIGVDDRDPSALQVYVLEAYRGAIPYQVQISRAQYLFDRWGEWLIRFGIEATAFQRARLHAVYRELGSEVGDRCTPVITLTDKVTRAWKLSARYEAGRIHHRKGATWTQDLEDQLVGFPKGKRDDMFDAVDLAVTLGCVVRARRKRERRVGLFGGGRATRRAVIVTNRGVL